MANILVIDDDAQVRRVLREILEEAGHTVTEAPSRRALDLSQTPLKQLLTETQRFSVCRVCPICLQMG